MILIRQRASFLNFGPGLRGLDNPRQRRLPVPFSYSFVQMFLFAGSVLTFNPSRFTVFFFALSLAWNETRKGKRTEWIRLACRIAAIPSRYQNSSHKRIEFVLRFYVASTVVQRHKGNYKARIMFFWLSKPQVQLTRLQKIKAATIQWWFDRGSYLGRFLWHQP